jgi:hypothetical protein
MKRRIYIEVVSFLTILLFLYTAISKLADYSVYKDQIALSPILEPFSGMLGWTLPLLEIATAIVLFFPRWRLVGLYVACGLMVAFSIYIVALFTIDDKLPCSCGGIIELLSWKQHLILNIGLVLLQVMAIKLQKQTVQEAQLSY